MKIISTSKALKSNLKRLIESYQNISFGVAWASKGTEPFELLLKNKRKIKNGVIGTHFYQTDPDVLDVFVSSEKVKFIFPSQGVYHPKIYFFWDDHGWEAIIGSANLTAGAMNKNTELCVLISNRDGDHFTTLQTILYSYMEQAQTVTKEYAEKYRTLWHQKKKSRDKLSDIYGFREVSKNILDSTVMSMDWPTFYQKIKNDNIHSFEDRILLLDQFRKKFLETKYFKDMDEDIRRGIAGIHSETIDKWGWFGSMIGAGKFKNVIINNHVSISDALDNIPLSGVVDMHQYKEYISCFIKAFPSGGGGIATATRLLSMKRPDQFICVNKANLNGLAKDIGIVKNKFDYDRYWYEIIERIMDTTWWKSEKPKEKKALSAWSGRAAMLDAIFYEEV
ncbi:hypothetical protein KP24_00045 [Pectobacterium atrosepticum]|uniref:phospholipase D family protein n=1 Tax=Pectobacterium atrosepticum TaxID=29471 RepID=UPI0005001119|nr:phospholipase D family protein [Pectobacterium atrosepticum]KFX25118.1 hypothetical protein KP24_00045 [Pectobacterium atrosepticum]